MHYRAELQLKWSKVEITNLESLLQQHQEAAAQQRMELAQLRLTVNDATSAAKQCPEPEAAGNILPAQTHSQAELQALKCELEQTQEQLQDSESKLQLLEESKQQAVQDANQQLHAAKSEVFALQQKLQHQGEHMQVQQEQAVQQAAAAAAERLLAAARRAETAEQQLASSVAVQRELQHAMTEVQQQLSAMLPGNSLASHPGPGSNLDTQSSATLTQTGAGLGCVSVTSSTGVQGESSTDTVLKQQVQQLLMQVTSELQQAHHTQAQLAKVTAELAHCMDQLKLSETDKQAAEMACLRLEQRLAAANCSSSVSVPPEQHLPREPIIHEPASTPESLQQPGVCAVNVLEADLLQQLVCQVQQLQDAVTLVVHLQQQQQQLQQPNNSNPHRQVHLNQQLHKQQQVQHVNHQSHLAGSQSQQYDAKPQLSGISAASDQRVSTHHSIQEEVLAAMSTPPGTCTPPTPQRQCAVGGHTTSIPASPKCVGNYQTAVSGSSPLLPQTSAVAFEQAGDSCALPDHPQLLQSCELLVQSTCDNNQSSSQGGNMPTAEVLLQLQQRLLQLSQELSWRLSQQRLHMPNHTDAAANTEPATAAAVAQTHMQQEPVPQHVQHVPASASTQTASSSDMLQRWAQLQQQTADHETFMHHVQLQVQQVADANARLSALQADCQYEQQLLDGLQKAGADCQMQQQALLEEISRLQSQQQELLQANHMYQCGLADLKLQFADEQMQLKQLQARLQESNLHSSPGSTCTDVAVQCDEVTCIPCSRHVAAEALPDCAAAHGKLGGADASGAAAMAATAPTAKSRYQSSSTIEPCAAMHYHHHSVQCIIRPHKSLPATVADLATLCELLQQEVHQLAAQSSSLRAAANQLCKQFKSGARTVRVRALALRHELQKGCWSSDVGCTTGGNEDKQARRNGAKRDGSGVHASDTFGEAGQVKSTCTPHAATVQSAGGHSPCSNDDASLAVSVVCHWNDVEQLLCELHQSCEALMHAPKPASSNRSGGSSRQAVGGAQSSTSSNAVLHHKSVVKRCKKLVHGLHHLQQELQGVLHAPATAEKVGDTEGAEDPSRLGSSSSHAAAGSVRQAQTESNVVAAGAARQAEHGLHTVTAGAARQAQRRVNVVAAVVARQDQYGVNDADEGIVASISRRDVSGGNTQQALAMQQPSSWRQHGADHARQVTDDHSRQTLNRQLKCRHDNAEQIIYQPEKHSSACKSEKITTHNQLGEGASKYGQQSQRSALLQQLKGMQQDILKHMPM